MADAFDQEYTETQEEQYWREQFDTAQRRYKRAMIEVQKCTRTLDGNICTGGWLSERQDDVTFKALRCRCMLDYLEAFHALAGLNGAYRHKHRGHDNPGWLPEGTIYDGTMERSQPLTPGQASTIAALCQNVGLPIPEHIRERSKEAV